jgi:hypothetical protein
MPPDHSLRQRWISAQASWPTNRRQVASSRWHARPAKAWFCTASANCGTVSPTSEAEALGAVPIHGETESAVAARSRCGDEELVEAVDEAWRGSDEVSGTWRDQPLGIEDYGERVADPLQPGGVTARSHQRRDARVPY